jgi:hypothetical protein
MLVRNADWRIYMFCNLTHATKLGYDQTTSNAI